METTLNLTLFMIAQIGKWNSVARKHGTAVENSVEYTVLEPGYFNLRYRGKVKNQVGRFQ